MPIKSTQRERKQISFQISMKINSLKKLCSHVPTRMFPLKCSHVPAKNSGNIFFCVFPLKKQWEHFVSGVRTRCSHVPTYLFRYFVPKRRGNMFPKSRKMFPLRWRQDAMFPLFPLFPRKNTTLKEKKMTHGEREKKKKKKRSKGYI